MPSQTPIEPAEVAGRPPRRLWSSTAWMALGRLWGSACTLILLWAVVEPLGPAGFGRFTFYLALFLVLDAAVDLGTGQATVQLTAGQPSNLPAVLARARRTRLALGLAACLGTSALAFASGEPGAPWIALASLYPMTHTLELSNVALRNRLRWGRPVAVRAAAAGLSLALVLGARALGAREPAVYLAAVAGGSILGNLGQHLASRAFLPPSRGVPPAAAGPFLRLALPMGVAALFQQLYFWQDNLIVRHYHGDAALGPYNLAVRCMSYGILLAVVATAAALPWLTREREAGRLGPALGRLAPPLLALAALGAGAAWPHAEAILGLFGEPFRAGAPSLRWLLLAVLAVYLGAPWLTGVVALGRGGGVLAIAAGACAVNLVGNLAWVPAEGALGAARATALTEACVALGSLGLLLSQRVLPVAGLRGAAALLAAPLLFLAARWISGSL